MGGCAQLCSWLSLAGLLLGSSEQLARLLGIFSYISSPTITMSPESKSNTLQAGWGWGSASLLTRQGWVGRQAVSGQWQLFSLGPGRRMLVFAPFLPCILCRLALLQRS